MPQNRHAIASLCRDVQTRTGQRCTSIYTPNLNTYTITFLSYEYPNLSSETAVTLLMTMRDCAISAANQMLLVGAAD